MMETLFYCEYIDDILIVMSLKDMEFQVHWLSMLLDQLLQSSTLRPAPSAFHDLGGVWGTYHTHRPPQLIDMRALSAMVNSVPVGNSYLGITLDNTPV